jgi:PiT family inorganic phosphate transporter
MWSDAAGLVDWVPWHLVLLGLALAIAFGFEFINGFHDTANAVATVIYTRALTPSRAVVWSGMWNFIGVHVGGIGVAYSIVNLLPVDLLVHINSRAGIFMVLSILVAATAWNLGTWWLGLPASSSHTLIGSILGVGLANSLLSGNGLEGINWTKAGEVATALLLSPLVGFGLAAALLMLSRKLIRDPQVHRAAEGDRPPPGWVRCLLIGTCTGVSFAHGSNDGQKGMGLIMLILIGMLPAHYALNPRTGAAESAGLVESVGRLESLLGPKVLPETAVSAVDVGAARANLRALRGHLESEGAARGLAGLGAAERWDARQRLLELNHDVTLILGARATLLPTTRAELQGIRKAFRGPVEYVPEWVVMGVAVSLGVGTTIGWKRIVVTVAEKIGKGHLTYSQGACAELVAMTTIGLADLGGLPVSTTHVLSSGIAGTMWADRTGVQIATVKRIALAWVLTLPASMLLSGGFFLLTRRVG